MDHILVRLIIDLICALAAGALIGAERSYNGRAAGLRTHALVAIAAAGGMSITLQPQLVAHAFPPGTLRFEPTRIGQGIMTGVGFLGAGVIFKEGVSVQGLTTAACIWATAALGMLFGLDMLGAGAAMTVGILLTLVVMRWLEDVLPHKAYALATFTFQTGLAPSETELEDLLDRHSVRLYDVSYAMLNEGNLLQYRANLATHRESGLPKLAAQLTEVPGLIAFDLSRLSR